MNRERMNLLLDVLAGVERGEAALLPHTGVDGKPVVAPEETRRLGFNMASWFCGTAACAAGHLCLDPRAQAQGLRLEMGMGQLVPHYEGEINYVALRDFLGIRYADALYLFEPYSYLPKDNNSAVWQRREAQLAAYRAVTPAQVAGRVRKLMDKDRLDTDRIATELRE